MHETSICVVDENGVIAREGKATSDPEAIGTWLGKLKLSFEKVGLEIGGIARWLCIELCNAGLAAVCIDPRRLRGVTRTMPVKTDRNDARAIAHAMRVGWFTPVHIKSTVSQEVRMLLTNRKTLLSKKIDIENEVRGTLRVFGIKLAGRITDAIFEKRALEVVEDKPKLLAMVRPMLAARAALREQYKVLHKLMLNAVREDATCRRLMTVPGVGPIVAITYVTTIDDPDRFHRSRDVGAHLGLTPRKYASGETDYNGRISKCGHARGALSGCTRPAHPNYTMVDAESVGHGCCETAWLEVRRCRCRSQTCCGAPSHLGRWNRVPLVTRTGDARMTI
jgi:transposase